MQAAELAARAASAAQAAASTAEIGRTSEFYGVYWDKSSRKWHAHVCRGGTIHHIAQFDVEADAARAVDEWLSDNYGEDPVNFDAAGQPVVRQSTDASIYRGVTPSRGRWQAQISVGGTMEYLGTFDPQREAAEAYDERAWQLGRGTNFTFDGLRNTLGANGKVVPRVRRHWTAALAAERAARIALDRNS